MDLQRNARFPMSQGEVITFNRSFGCTIKAVRGRLQITQLQTSAHFILDAGQSFLSKSSGALTTQAMSHAFVSIVDTHFTSTPVADVDLVSARANA